MNQCRSGLTVPLSDACKDLVDRFLSEPPSTFMQALQFLKKDYHHKRKTISVKDLHLPPALLYEDYIENLQEKDIPDYLCKNLSNLWFFNLKEKKILEMRYLEGKTFVQMAAFFKKTCTAVRNHCIRITRRLQRTLSSPANCIWRTDMPTYYIRKLVNFYNDFLTLNELAEESRIALVKRGNLGIKTVQQIENLLHRHGLALKN